MPMPAEASPLDRRGDSSIPMETWLSEWRRLARTMAWDATTALGRLAHCRSPTDLVQVQQAWVMAWLGASMESGMRLLGVSAEALTPQPAPEKIFHLPD